MDTPHLKAELRGRDHAMILLGIGSALIILWLLLHRKGNVTNETINNEGGGIDYPASPWPDYVLQQVGPGSYSYDLAYQPGSFDPGNISLALPAENVGIENCACGCDDFVAPTLLPGPVPTLIVKSAPAPQEVVVIKPPPPPPPKASSGMDLMVG